MRLYHETFFLASFANRLPVLPDSFDQVYGYITGAGILPIGQVRNWRRSSSSSPDTTTGYLGEIPASAKGALATITTFISNGDNE